MLSETLFNTVEAIREYQAEMPDAYDKLKSRLDKFVEAIEVMAAAAEEAEDAAFAGDANGLADEALELAETF
jgi:hypothetical protein